MHKRQVRSPGGEDHLEKGIATYSIFLPGKSHGQRSLVNMGSPWGCKSWTWLSNQTVTKYTGIYYTSQIIFFFFFTSWSFVTALLQASLMPSFFHWHLLMFLSLCHILANSQNIWNFFLIVCYGDLWSVAFNVITAKRLQPTEGSDDG